MSGPPAASDPRVGLCADCRFGRAQPSAKGAVFWRCLRARSDPAYRPYPPLPVIRCAGFAQKRR